MTALTTAHVRLLLRAIERSLEEIERADKPRIVPVESSLPALVGATKAARMLNMSRRWLYKHGHKLPFAIRVGDSWRFDTAKLRQWLADGAGR